MLNKASKTNMTVLKSSCHVYMYIFRGNWQVRQISLKYKYYLFTFNYKHMWIATKNVKKCLQKDWSMVTFKEEKLHVLYISTKRLREFT